MNTETMTTQNIRTKDRDLDLTEAVKDVLHNMDFVRESGLNLQIDVSDGVVTVSGVVLSRLMKRAVLQAIRREPGVHRVIDSLFNDTDLVIAVSQALSVDLVTKQLYEIKVTSNRGEVTLSGSPRDENLIDAATELASRVPGVRQVVNHLAPAETTMLEKAIASNKPANS